MRGCYPLYELCGKSLADCNYSSDRVAMIQRENYAKASELSRSKLLEKCFAKSYDGSKYSVYVCVSFYRINQTYSIIV